MAKGKTVGAEDKAEVKPWTDYPVLVELEFEQLIERRQQADAAMKGEKSNLESFNTDIEVFMAAAGAKTVMVGKWKVVTAGGRSQSVLNPQKLMALGVDPDVIAKCWDAGTDYTYAQVIDTEKPRRNRGAK